MKVLCVVTFFLSRFLFLDLDLVTGTPEFTNCPTSPLCINEPVSYQCTVDTSGSANSLQWRVLNATGSILGDTSYDPGASVGAMRTIIGTQFTTNLTSRAGSSVLSDITFTPAMDINNYTVECRGLDSSTPAVVGTDTCSILIKGILPAPFPNELTTDSNYFNFSWTPQSTSPCLSSYIVFVNSSVSNVTYTTTDTSLELPTQPFNDTEYSVSVGAVDTGGRYMNSQGMRIFTPDVPQNVTNLVLNQTYPDDDDDDTVNITVSWNEPSSSSRPNISSYIIYHNVTDPDTSMMVSNSTTTYNIPDATVGSVYTVGVAAVNVLGTGETTSAIISISNVPSSTPSMNLTPTMSSTAPTETPVDTNTSTSSTSPSPTTGSGTGGLDSTVYIGIGAGAAVIVIVILILIIVSCLIWRKPWKGEKAIFNQSKRDSTEPIALVDKKDHGSSPATGQPIYQEAMSSEDIQREAAPTTGELYAQPSKASIRRPPPQPQSELATYQDPSTIQRTQAPNTEYLYAEVDKKPQQQAVYAQVDKEKKGGDGTVYADLDLKNAHSGPVSGSNPANVIYSDVHNN